MIYIETLLLELNFWAGNVEIRYCGGGDIVCIVGKDERQVVGRGNTYKHAIQNCLLALVERLDAKEDRSLHRVIGEEADQIRQELLEERNASNRNRR